MSTLLVLTGCNLKMKIAQRILDEGHRKVNFTIVASGPCFWPPLVGSASGFWSGGSGSGLWPLATDLCPPASGLWHPAFGICSWLLAA